MIIISVKKTGSRKTMYLVSLEGSGTYLIKEELKYQGFRWNPSLRRWEKIFEEKSDADEIVKYLKRFIEVENAEIEVMNKNWR